MTSPMTVPAAPAETADAPALRTACFAVVAAPDPGLLLRVLEPFAKIGLVPDRLYGTRTADGRDEDGAVHIDLQVTGLTPVQGDHIAAVLRGQFLVETVLLSWKTA